MNPLAGHNSPAAAVTQAGPGRLIEARGLCLGYAHEGRTLSILQDLNLDLAPAESVAILGPSGSGKSSLLLLLSGLEEADAGHIYVGDRCLAELTADERADWRRDQLGIIFQSFHLMPSLNARDNVALPLEIAGRQDARDQALAMLERVGLKARAEHFPGQLSGGEQQRVAIARALVHQPALVLADEPTGNLDERTGAQISEVLFELCEHQGSALILVTHDQRLAVRCHRRLALRDGRLVADD